MPRGANSCCLRTRRERVERRKGALIDVEAVSTRRALARILSTARRVGWRLRSLLRRCARERLRPPGPAEAFECAAEYQLHARCSDRCGNDMARAMSGAKADMTHKDDAQREGSFQ
jgi:hypothetical protein